MAELGTNSVSLAEVIAYLKQTHRTGRLLVRVPPGESAEVSPVSQLLFEEGRLVDARGEQEQGDDLVYRLLALPAATFVFDRLKAEQLPGGRNIDRIQQMLVLAAIGALDEEAAEHEDEPPQEDHPLPTAPEELPVRIRYFNRRNMIPLPAGKQAATPQTLARDDFQSFMDQLDAQQVSGYVTWVSSSAEGLLLLFMGQVINAIWSELRTQTTYEDVVAVERFAQAAGLDHFQHVSLYTLNPDFVWAYSSIAYGSDRQQEQSLIGVNLTLLLERLARRQHTGCIKTVAGNQAAYIFMARGVVLGDYQALPDSLAEAPGRSQILVQQPGSLVDIYTSPPSEELLVLNETRWTIKRVALELSRAAEDILGARASQVTSLLDAAGEDPGALRSASSRAKKITKVFASPEEHQALSKRIDMLLGRLP